MSLDFGSRSRRSASTRIAVSPRPYGRRSSRLASPKARAPEAEIAVAPTERLVSRLREGCAPRCEERVLFEDSYVLMPQLRFEFIRAHTKGVKHDYLTTCGAREPKKLTEALTPCHIARDRADRGSDPVSAF